MFASRLGTLHLGELGNTRANRPRENNMATKNSNSNDNDAKGKNPNGNGDSMSGAQGFASMDPEKQKQIASEGGKAAHESGNAHEFTSEEAKEAGKKGGQSKSSSGGEDPEPTSKEK